MESHSLLKLLIAKNIKFIGTVEEMRDRLDIDLRIGAMYTFNCYWRGDTRIPCGPVTGTLVERILNADNSIQAYKLRVNTTNTSTGAPSIMSECIVNSPALLRNAKYS